ncbi:MAG: hemerythrin domain-containing protein [Ferruginibacter sp.]
MKNTSFISKRNLAWLSRNHYDGLLTVCKIRRSLRYGIANTSIKAFILEEFKSHLQPHLIVEEEWLFPKLPGENHLRIHAEKQHAELRSMVKDFCDSPDLNLSLPEEFANLLEEHIRFEERTLFPFIEKQMNENELNNK